MQTRLSSFSEAQHADVALEVGPSKMVEMWPKYEEKMKKASARTSLIRARKSIRTSANTCIPKLDKPNTLCTGRLQ